MPQARMKSSQERNDCKMLCPVLRFNGSSGESSFLLVTFILRCVILKVNFKIKHHSLDLPK